jgi:aminoglycoside/choline kinase family phosphotransferase
LPQTAWLKGGFETHGFAHAASYVAEARFFLNWAPSLPINMPRSWWAAEDDEGRQGLVLLEDLADRSASYGLSTAPIGVADARSVLSLLAALHAAHWRSPALSALRSYTDRFAAADYWLDRFLEPTYYEQCTSSARGETAPARLRDPSGMRQAVLGLWEISNEGACCFTHGDSHLGNYFFEANGEPGLLDWQAYLRGQPLFDVAYFLGGALTTEDRRVHEKDLIVGYLDALREGGADAPTFDEAWLAYRRYALHGFLWVATPTVMHPEEVIEAYARRYGAMCDDLQTIEALGGR